MKDQIKKEFEEAALVLHRFMEDESNFDKINHASTLMVDA